MSKKDYNALAQALSTVRPDEKTTDLDVMDQWKMCIHAVAEVCEQDNNRFNYQRFIEACEQ